MMRPNISYQSASEHVCGMTKDAVDDYAARAAANMEFRPGGDIAALVLGIGGRISYHDPLELEADQDTIFVHGPGDFDLLLSSISGPNRDRFTIAHELGHYLLHSRQGEIPLHANRSGSGRAEWEANWFAGGFLMPAEAFRNAHKSGKGVFELAAQFGVSEAAAVVRMKVLGLR